METWADTLLSAPLPEPAHTMDEYTYGVEYSRLLAQEICEIYPKNTLPYRLPKNKRDEMRDYISLQLDGGEESLHTAFFDFLVNHHVNEVFHFTNPLNAPSILTFGLFTQEFMRLNNIDIRYLSDRLSYVRDHEHNWSRFVRVATTCRHPFLKAKSNYLHTPTTLYINPIIFALYPFIRCSNNANSRKVYYRDNFDPLSLSHQLGTLSFPGREITPFEKGEFLFEWHIPPEFVRASPFNR